MCNIFIPGAVPVWLAWLSGCDGMRIVQEREVKVNLEDMKKEEGCFSKGASAGGSSIFTPRSSPSDVAAPTFDSSPLPTMSPSPPSFVWLPTPPYTTFYSPRPWDLMPGHQWLICGACHSWGNVIMS